MGLNSEFIKGLNIFWKFQKVDQKHFREIFKFYAEERWTDGEMNYYIWSRRIGQK